MGQKYLASGVHVAMRLWEDEPPGTAKVPSQRDYETVGYVINGRAELHLEGQTVVLSLGTPGSSPKALCIPITSLRHLRLLRQRTRQRMSTGGTKMVRQESDGGADTAIRLAEPGSADRRHTRPPTMYVWDHPALHQKSGQYADPSVNIDLFSLILKAFSRPRETYFLLLKIL